VLYKQLEEGFFINIVISLNESDFISDVQCLECLTTICFINLNISIKLKHIELSIFSLHS